MSIEIEDLSFGYKPERQILHHITCSMADGQITSIIGSNGTGKTTLLRCMLGLLPYQGNITISGGDLKACNRLQLSRLMAYVPQKCNVSYNYETIEMVMMGASGRIGRYATPGKKEETEAMEAMEKIGIASLAHQLFWEISGGEQQLVLVARSLMQGARTLLLDEPVASLDFANQAKVLWVVRALADDGYCVILTSHNPDQVFRFSDQVIAVKQGSVLHQGKPDEVVTAPLIKELYGIETEVFSLADDTIRVCIPKEDIQ